MTASFKPVSVAIGDLTAHPANVRSNSPETYDSENIAHLKASIAVLGLLQPLLVQKLDGKYAVLAGGRRHAALKELVADKVAKGFTAKTKVDCRLVPEECDVTTALSLAENITQAPMNAIEPPLVCRRPRSKDTGLWKRTNVETDIHLKCANVLCGWCSNIRVNLTASLQRSNRLRLRLVVGRIRCVRGLGEPKRTAVDAMV